MFFFDFIPFAFRRMFQHYEKGLRQVALCEAQTWNGFFLERRPAQSACLMSGALDEHTHEAVVRLEQQVFTSISLREMESLLDQNHEQNERAKQQACLPEAIGDAEEARAHDDIDGRIDMILQPINIAKFVTIL